MRAVRTDWAPAASVFVPSDMFPQVIAAITGEEEDGGWTYSYSALDESFILRVARGQEFLDRLRRTRLEEVMAKIEDGIEPGDAECCIANLRSMARQWAKFIDEDGGLEIWVDAN